jgi:hypothetical protein
VSPSLLLFLGILWFLTAAWFCSRTVFWKVTLSPTGIKFTMPFSHEKNINWSEISSIALEETAFPIFNLASGDNRKSLKILYPNKPKEFLAEVAKHVSPKAMLFIPKAPLKILDFKRYLTLEKGGFYQGTVEDYMKCLS